MNFFKKAFTIIEMIIVVIILSVGILWVVATLTDSYSFLYNMRNKLIAINFARWWMEWVFNMRNTNWQRWAGKKDRCWLKINPLLDKNDDGCENDDWFGSGSYIINLTWNEQKYFYLQKTSWVPLLMNWNLTWSDWKYLLCKNNDGVVLPCHSIPSKRPNDYFDSALYFRQVRWWYLIWKKDGTDYTDCKNWDDRWKECWDGRFLEKNFCVDVMWFDGTKKSISFCSVLTNFKE